ncbi:type I polyketide synthase [Streptomyces sp. NPDC048172]|uniref:type I polyketide synthase n=1 Tax=Streptomyces sp. NPDC048172 TaxID=3365505 RepID=UPI003710EF7D
MADEDKLRQYLKKATGELRRTARELQDAELRESEPLAIIGMGCRFPPGLNSPDELWRFVADEGDGITPFPADRGWDTAGSADAHRGGFVAGADRFDAAFFGIGEHEALAMDPQQRLLLETSWEAVEHAGLDPAALRGTPTAVYAGVSYSHYGTAHQGHQGSSPSGVEDQLIVGGTPSTVSGRVAYTLGLHGPALSVDTACSSSLVALHLACQGLRRGDCELALAGGVTVMATPNVILEFGSRGALASDGRCKPFADAADGIGFSEGAGLLVLERLSVARRRGHAVLAVIRGSAVNQDGATNGLTSPSRPAQEAVIRQALENARLAPDQVDALEGHGTGTPLGDSIEAEAVMATYGAARPADRPLLLGSVKGNIGHTQTASGVAGVIKTVMSLRAGTHARTLHIDRPSSYVDWSGGTVALTTESRPWPADGRPRRAGVSSFGISGTNAHLILEEPEAADADAGDVPASDVPTADVPTPWVLSAKTEPALRAMAGELADSLSARPPSAAEVGISLARTRAGFTHRAVSVGTSVDEHLAALTALARGAEAPGLTTGTAAAARTAVVFTGGGEPGTEAAVRGLAERFPVFAEAHDAVRTRLEAQLGGPLTAYRHAAVFAFHRALYELLRAYGVTPEVVAGSGVGEISAAHAAGVLSSADAEALVAAADSNSLRSTAGRIACAAPRLTLVTSAGPGAPAEGPADGPGHWAAGDFLCSGSGDVLDRVRAQGATACLELDPGGLGTARDVLARLAAWYTAGATVGWEAAFAGTGARQVRLPGYPFQRKRYWLEAPPRRGGGDHLVRAAVHPLLGGALDLPGAAERRFAGTLPPREPWYAEQYRLRGTPALPPAAVAEWALAAARHGAHDAADDGTRTIRNLTFGEPVTLPGTGPLAVQAVADTHGAARRIRGFSAGPGDGDRDGGWTLRFTASTTATASEDAPPPPSPTDLDALRSRLDEQDPEALFARLDTAGIACGPALRQLARRWWRGDDEALALIATDPSRTAVDRYALHPALLEMCFLTAVPLLEDDGLWLPSGLTRLTLLTCRREPPERLWCHVRRTPDGAFDLELCSDTGEPLATVTGLTYAPSGLAESAGPAGQPVDAGLAGQVPEVPEEPWDAGELARLAVEEPQAAREALTDLLFARVSGLVGGFAEDAESLRARFSGTRLGDVGLDSMAAMRIREQFRSALSVDVPPQRLLGDSTVADVVELVCRSLAAQRLVAAPDEDPEATGPLEELIL